MPRTTVAVVNATHALNSRPRAGAVIGKALFSKPRQTFTVGIMALRLPEYVAVPVKTVMFQLTQNSFCCTGNFTRRIDIFNADQPLTLTGASL